MAQQSSFQKVWKILLSKIGSGVIELIDAKGIDMQGVSCKGACAQARVRCEVARVRAKRLLKYVRNVGTPHTCDRT